MNTKQYGAMVHSLAKPGIDITPSPKQLELWHMATGVSGEAGELLDAIKKHVIYSKPLDRRNVIEELGDLEFYMEGVRQAIGISREQVILHNMNKLTGTGGRYSDGSYSDEQAQARQDKTGELPND